MVNEQVLSNMDFILSETEKKVIKVHTGTDGKQIVDADLHGMTCKVAKRFITNIIAMDQSAFEFRLIHGYNHGTALKEMISITKFSERVQSKRGLPYNYGITILDINAKSAA